MVVGRVLEMLGSREVSVNEVGPVCLGHRVTHITLWPSRPGEFHREPLTDPDVNLTIHPARATQRRLPPSAKTRSSSGCPLTPS